MRQFSAKVKPGSKVGPLIEEEVNGDMTVYLREPAHDGRANVALVQLIAKHHDVPKSSVKIIRGISSRHKLIRIE